MYSVYHYDSQFFTMITHLNGRVLNLLTENLNGPIKLYLTFDWNACRKQRVSRLCIISCARIFAIWILELFWVCGTTYFFFFFISFHDNINSDAHNKWSLLSVTLHRKITDSTFHYTPPEVSFKIVLTQCFQIHEMEHTILTSIYPVLLCFL